MATKTRGKNEGCIHQRKEDGLWLGKISLGYDANGKRLRKTVYGKTRREVAEKLKKLLSLRSLNLTRKTNALLFRTHAFGKKPVLKQGYKSLKAAKKKLRLLPTL